MALQKSLAMGRYFLAISKDGDPPANSRASQIHVDVYSKRSLQPRSTRRCVSDQFEFFDDAIFFGGHLLLRKRVQREN